MKHGAETASISSLESPEELRRAREPAGRAVNFEAFVAHAPAAMAVFDREMRYLAVNDRWVKDYGLDGSPVGRMHYDVFPEIPELLEGSAPALPGRGGR